MPTLATTYNVTSATDDDLDHWTDDLEEALQMAHQHPDAHVAEYAVVDGHCVTHRWHPFAAITEYPEGRTIHPATKEN